VKEFLQYWGSTIFTGIVIFGLGTAVIVQDIRHSARQLNLQQELMDVYHFNGQLTTDNEVKRYQLDQADDLINRQQDILDQMYKEIMKLRGIPIPEERPNKSEA